jgi:hypothetical protein
MIQYKLADSVEELQKIYRLNYQTFVEEIPQHTQNATQQLVDVLTRKMNTLLQ